MTKLQKNVSKVFVSSGAPCSWARGSAKRRVRVGSQKEGWSMLNIIIAWLFALTPLMFLSECHGLSRGDLGRFRFRTIAREGTLGEDMHFQIQENSMDFRCLFPCLAQVPETTAEAHMAMPRAALLTSHLASWDRHLSKGLCLQSTGCSFPQDSPCPLNGTGTQTWGTVSYRTMQFKMLGKEGEERMGKGVKRLIVPCKVF